jgi:predicted PurR-regulated permease PerM
LTAQLTPQRVAELSRAAERWLSTHGIPVSFGDDGSVDAVVTSQEAAGLAAGADESLGGARLQLDLERMLREGISTASEWLRTHVVELVNYSQKLVAKLLGGVFMFFFMLMVAAFVLVDTGAILAFLRSLAPRAWRPSHDALLAAVDEKLAGVVRGQILICLVNGVLTLTGLLIFQVKFAFVLASIATVLSFIPIFGTVISTIPIVLVGLTQSFSTAVAALLWILGIHAVEAYLLNPKILGTSAKIHPAMVAFSILAGERTFGFVGALFAVPVASIMIATFEHVRRQAEALPGEAALEPTELLEEVAAADG